MRKTKRRTRRRRTTTSRRRRTRSPRRYGLSTSTSASSTSRGSTAPSTDCSGSRHSSPAPAPSASCSSAARRLPLRSRRCSRWACSSSRPYGVSPPPRARRCPCCTRLPGLCLQSSCFTGCAKSFVVRTRTLEKSTAPSVGWMRSSSRSWMKKSPTRTSKACFVCDF